MFNLNEMKIYFLKRKLNLLLGRKANFEKFKKFCQKQLPGEVVEFYFNHSSCNVARFSYVFVRTQILPERIQLKLIEDDFFPLRLIESKNLTPEVQLKLVQCLTDSDDFPDDYTYFLTHQKLTKETLKELLFQSPLYFIENYESAGIASDEVYSFLVELYVVEKREIKWTTRDKKALKAFFEVNKYSVHPFSYLFLKPLILNVSHSEDESSSQITFTDSGQFYFEDCLKKCHNENSKINDFETSFFSLEETWFGNFHDLVEAAVVLGPDVYVSKKN